MMPRIRERSGLDAISAAFASARAQGRCAFIPYLTMGYPSPADTPELVLALQSGGADIIELGVPFSDPVADGPTIQRASQVALDAGVTPSGCLGIVAELRDGGVSVPLVLMGYYNPIHSYGVEEYAHDCAAAGVDGLIVPDLPPEEAAPLRAACQHHGVALVFLIAPTTSDLRIAKVASETEGFLYVVSRLGITGTDTSPGEELADRLDLIRRYARTPVAVGFGISRPDQVRDLAPRVAGIIVGSAIVKRAEQGAEALVEYVSSLRPALAVAATGRQE